MYNVDMAEKSNAKRPGEVNYHVPFSRAYPNIVDVMAEKELKVIQKLELSIERVMLEYMRIAFLDPDAIYNNDGSLKPLNEIPEDARRAIASIEPGKYGSKDRNALINSKIAALNALTEYLHPKSLKVNVDVSDNLANLIAERRAKVIASVDGDSAK